MKISEAPLGQRLLCKYSGGLPNISGIPIALAQITKEEVSENGLAFYLHIEDDESSRRGWFDAKEVDSKWEVFDVVCGANFHRPGLRVRWIDDGGWKHVDSYKQPPDHGSR